MPPSFPFPDAFATLKEVKKILLLSAVLFVSTLFIKPPRALAAACFPPTNGFCPYATLCSDKKTCCNDPSRDCPGVPKPTPFVGATGCYPSDAGCGYVAKQCAGTKICCPSGLTCPPPGTLLNSLPSDGSLTGYQSTSNGTKKVCDFISDAAQKKLCGDCFDGTPPGSWTAIGCIKTDPTEFIKSFLGFGIGIAGGIAFLLILLGGFQILTSAGNPEQLNAGRELVGSAVSGLLMIIFSIFLLRVIGVNVLGIPGFQ